jgi:hypothetical protein
MVKSFLAHCSHLKIDWIIVTQKYTPQTTQIELSNTNSLKAMAPSPTPRQRDMSPLTISFPHSIDTDTSIVIITFSCSLRWDGAVDPTRTEQSTLAHSCYEFTEEQIWIAGETCLFHIWPTKPAGGLASWKLARRAAAAASKELRFWLTRPANAMPWDDYLKKIS